MIAARIAFAGNASDAERAAYFEQHRQYLRSGSVKILKSGPFSAGEIKGALIVAEVAELSELEAFSRLDPFVVHGIYAETHIVRWEVTLNHSTQWAG